HVEPRVTCSAFDELRTSGCTKPADARRWGLRTVDSNSIDQSNYPITRLPDASYLSRLYFRSAWRSASCEMASVLWPSTPIIVSAATSAFTIASSVACTVASNTAPMRALDIIDTCAASGAFAAPAFAVENAMKMSPDPLLETLP